MAKTTARLRLATITFALALTACAQQPPPEPQVWGRFDCRRIAQFPELQMELDQARTVCSHSATAQGIAGTQAMRVQSLGDAFAQSAAQNRVQLSSALACMADRGWLFATVPAHEARCPAPAPAAPPPPVSRRK
jgi:hypothetical protein